MNSQPQPLVSVVMPSLNQAGFLAASLDSVLSQCYPQVELIVADGGSADGSLALLEEKRKQDPRLRILAGPDAGPADAVNKGLRAARGTVIGWLNSDDLYAPGAVERAVAALLEHEDWLLAYGQGQHIDERGTITGTYPTLAPPVPIDRFQQGCFICQPTVFFRRTLPLLLGGLDTTLQTAFDLDYWLRAFKAFPGRIGFVATVQAYSRLHPHCITRRMRRTVALEGMRVLAEHLGAAPRHCFTAHLAEIRADGGYSPDYAADLLAESRPYLLPQDHAYLSHRIAAETDRG